MKKWGYWLQARLKEKTTYMGLSMLLGACGVAVDMASIELAVSGVSGVIGLILAASKEKDEPAEA